MLRALRRLGWLAISSVALSAADAGMRVSPLRPTLQGDCPPGWRPTFGGLPGCVGGRVRAIASGATALYVGGDITHAGGVAVNSIAKWDGSSWSALGSGMSASVFALTVFDGGGG